MKRRSREVSIFSMSALDLFASALGAFILLAIVMFPYFPNTGTADQRDLEEALGRLQEEEANSQELQEVLQEIREDFERRLADVRAAAQREVEAARQERDDAQSAAAAAQQDAETARAAAAVAQRELSDAHETLAEGGDRENALEQALERERRRKFLLVTVSWDDEDDVDLHVVDPAGNEFYYGATTHRGSSARFEEDTVNGPGNEVWLHPQVTPGEYRIYYNLFRENGAPGVSVRGAVAHSIDRDELPSRRLAVVGERTLVATVVVDRDANVTVR